MWVTQRAVSNSFYTRIKIILLAAAIFRVFGRALFKHPRQRPVPDRDDAVFLTFTLGDEHRAPAKVQIVQLEVAQLHTSQTMRIWRRCFWRYSHYVTDLGFQNQCGISGLSVLSNGQILPRW